MAYNRYSKFISEGKYKIIPSVKIPIKGTDYYTLYKKGSTRLDILSNEYYGDPNYDWLIMMANPEYGSLEFSIPDKVMLRIPYPLQVSLGDYEQQIKNYETINGIE